MIGVRRHIAAALVTAGVLLAASGAARAHTRSLSHARWTLDAEGGRVRVRLSLLDLSALEAVMPGSLARARAGLVSDALADHLQRTVVLERGGEACTPVPGSVEPLRAARGFVRYGWRVRCAKAGAGAVRSDLLMDAVPAHLHYATVRLPDGAELQRVLDPGARRASVPALATGEPAGALHTVAAHLGLGMEHILGGWDHLVFLFALLLVAGSLRDLALTVTGFTLGHSVTLAAAALGWVSPDGAAVEALIGLSIALVAAENVWLASTRRDLRLPAAVVGTLLLATALAVPFGSVPATVTLGMAIFAACQLALLHRMDHPARWRWTVASAFGLVHGLGFAGALAELTPEGDALVPALLGFNAGVEIGQLALIALAWPVLAWWSRRDGRRWWLVHGGSAAAAAAGCFWFVVRAFG